ncbi:MAG TPA: prepilin peptidase, partial [Anaeromyxobacter sp.]
MDEPLGFLVGAWVVLAGAAIGSFLNVVIARVPAGESIVRPASRCPGCRSPIAWYDNVPVVSWLVLRGRCRRCGMRIPVRYPLVELAGAAVAFLAWSRHGLSLATVAEIAFVDALLCLALIDLATWLLPYAITLPVIAAGLAAAAAGAAPAPSLRASVVGA